jgi:hypothetical protein
MMKSLFPALIVSTTSITSLLPTTANATPIYLDCHHIGKTTPTWELTLNENRSTVIFVVIPTGHTYVGDANFTNRFVTWYEDVQDGDFTANTLHTLNRYDGTFTMKTVFGSGRGGSTRAQCVNNKRMF